MQQPRGFSTNQVTPSTPKKRLGFATAPLGPSWCVPAPVRAQFGHSNGTVSQPWLCTQFQPDLSMAISPVNAPKSPIRSDIHRQAPSHFSRFSRRIADRTSDMPAELRNRPKPLSSHLSWSECDGSGKSNLFASSSSARVIVCEVFQSITSNSQENSPYTLYSSSSVRRCPLAFLASACARSNLSCTSFRCWFNRQSLNRVRRNLSRNLYTHALAWSGMRRALLPSAQRCHRSWKDLNKFLSILAANLNFLLSLFQAIAFRAVGFTPDRQSNSGNLGVPCWMADPKVRRKSLYCNQLQVAVVPGLCAFFGGCMTEPRAYSLPSVSLSLVEGEGA